MTEAEWLACADPDTMLHVVCGRRCSPRRWWLFAVTCGRHNPHKLTSGEYHLLLEELEKFADGRSTVQQLRRVMGQAGYARDALDRSPLGQDPSCFAFGEAQDLGRGHSASRLLRRTLRDLFGGLFRLHTLGPGCQSPTIRALAQAAYEERPLSTGCLDVARLSVLSDALEEAGCDDAELLGHLRWPGPHVRGCRALDLVLGKS